jgi:hypothetical protein
MKALIIVAGLILGGTLAPAAAQVDASPNADVNYRVPSATSAAPVPTRRPREFSSFSTRQEAPTPASDRTAAPNGGGNF